MNLQWKHLPLIFLGGAIGSTLGWLASLLFKQSLIPEADSTISLHVTDALFGGIVAIGLTAIVIVVRAGRDPKTGPPGYFMRLHGMGSTLIGRSEPHADGSYVTTEWFTIIYVPIFPVCRYRVTEHFESSTPFSTPYTIHEKLPARLIDAARVCGLILLVLLSLAVLLFFLFR